MASFDQKLRTLYNVYSSKFLVTCETHHSSYKRTVQNFVSNETLNTNFALYEIEIL